MQFLNNQVVFISTPVVNYVGPSYGNSNQVLVHPPVRIEPVQIKMVEEQTEPAQTTNYSKPIRSRKNRIITAYAKLVIHQSKCNGSSIFVEKTLQFSFWKIKIMRHNGIRCAVAKEICLILGIRGSNVFKSTEKFREHKFVIPAAYRTKRGNISVHNVIVLSANGVKQLLLESYSPLANYLLIELVPILNELPVK